MPWIAAAALCLVVAVGDGDSLTVRCAEQATVQVRVAAIDAPELRQAWGQRARRQLATLCLHQRARIRSLGQDKYGRTLAEVRCRERDVAAEQVRAGLAWVHPGQASAHPLLVQAAARARQARTGLWQQKRPMAPWTYRQRHAARGG